MPLNKSHHGHGGVAVGVCGVPVLTYPCVPQRAGPVDPCGPVCTCVELMKC